MHDIDALKATAPVIITLAPVDYTHIETFPSADALARDICDSYDAGASVVHFHVTDATGRATDDTSFFDGVVERVREHCDIVVQGSTGGVGVPWEVRTAALAASGLEMASLNMGSCNLFGRAYINTPEDIAALGGRMHEAGVIPDMCFFEPGFFTSLSALEDRQPARSRRVFSLCLGFPGALPGTIENLAFMVSKLPHGAEWTLVYHGAPDFALLAAAIAAGGNIRVGFEDSRALGAGAVAARNAGLVEKAHSMVEQLGRTVATPDEVRRRYDIPDKCRMMRRV
ncbi:MAG: 3-keto-5-aminohexanoate cleavage protein [Opitutaceae bacterium]